METITCVTDKHHEGACASLCLEKRPTPKWNMNLRKRATCSTIKDEEIDKAMDVSLKTAPGIIQQSQNTNDAETRQSQIALKKQKYQNDSQFRKHHMMLQHIIYNK